MRALTIAVWVLVPACLWAAPTAPDKDDKALNPVEKVRKDLDAAITIKIDKQPLSTAVQMLRDKTKINIVLDSATIQQQLGFTPDQPPAPVQVDFTNAKARSVLGAVLAPYGLSYAVLGDTVVVTTEDMAMLRQMRQRVNIDLNKVALSAAIKQIGRETATNLIMDARVDQEAKTTVSLQLEDVPLETAVRLLSEMAGLKPVRVGNTLFVTKKEIANEMRNDPDFVQQNQPIASIYAQQAAGIGGVTTINTPPTLPPAPPISGPTPAPSPGGTGPAAPPPTTVPPANEDKE